MLISCQETIEDPMVPTTIDDITQQNTGMYPLASISDSLTFLALGDSYTVGTAEARENSWPVQFVDKLRENNVPAFDPLIIAGAGWTTNNLLTILERRNIQEKYDLVSLLIGVNNQFQGIDFAVFKQQFQELIEYARSRVRDQRGLFVLSIPDYGATPFGQSNETQIGADIDMYNAHIQEVCEKEGIVYYDVTEISRQAKNNPDLLAQDNLHPSKDMYALWVETILTSPPVLLEE